MEHIANSFYTSLEVVKAILLLIIPKIQDTQKMQIEHECVVNFHIPLSLETAVAALGVRSFEMTL